jgi:uncharacterized membrane protein
MRTGRRGGGRRSDVSSSTKEEEATMPRLFSIKPAITLRGRRFRGVRGWAGKPSHPPFTDFPVVAYVFAAAFDLISLFTWNHSGTIGEIGAQAFVAATFVIMGGAVVSLVTATTGAWDWWKGIDRDHTTGPIGTAKHTQVWRTVNWHAVVMLTVTAIVIVDIVVRLTGYGTHHATALVTVLSVVAGLLVSYGAIYGGALVYDYAFNVEGQDDSTVWDETEVDFYPEQHSGSEP